jgi:ketosteroid isomerase-like protein
MSTENVEVVRAAYRAFSTGDLKGLGEHFADNIEWETPESLPLGGVTRGRDAVLSNFAQISQYWSEFSVEPDEYIDAGDHVVVRGVQRAVGAGGASESRYLHLCELRENKIVRGEYIADTAKGRMALGESELAARPA